MNNSNEPEDIEALYKKGASELPSLTLDERIIESAKQALHASKQDSQDKPLQLLHSKWRWPLSAAASIVLALTIYLPVYQNYSPDLLEESPSSSYIPDKNIAKPSTPQNMLEKKHQGESIDAIETMLDHSANDVTNIEARKKTFGASQTKAEIAPTKPHTINMEREKQKAKKMSVPETSLESITSSMDRTNTRLHAEKEASVKLSINEKAELVFIDELIKQGKAELAQLRLQKLLKDKPNLYKILNEKQRNLVDMRADTHKLNK